MNDNDESADRVPAAPTMSVLPVLAGGSQSIAGAARPCGLALDFVEGEFLVQLWSEEGGEPLSLGPYADEDVIAIWRRMASVSGLPLLLPGPDGTLQQPYPQLGRLLVGEKADRRRLAILSGRRPRFLAKRRATSMPRRPRVHREAEIVSGRSR